MWGVTQLLLGSLTLGGPTGLAAPAVGELGPCLLCSQPPRARAFPFEGRAPVPMTALSAKSGSGFIQLMDVSGAPVLEGAVWVHPGAFPHGRLLRFGVEEGFEDVLVVDRDLSLTLRYELGVPPHSSLRLVDGCLELLDPSGSPFIRMNPPFSVAVSGERRPAQVEVVGCSVDTDPSPPWGRPHPSPGANSCQVSVSFDAIGMPTPIALDPTWESPASKMISLRKDHSATTLEGGRVMIMGGAPSESDPPIQSTEYFDPATRTWAAGPNLLTPRKGHTATTLLDGRILIAGGVGPSGNTDAAELFDLKAFSPAASPLSTTRARHAAVLMESGKVLITGGSKASLPPYPEVFDPTCDCFSQLAGQMLVHRSRHSTTTLPDGRIFAAGGDASSDSTSSSTELFDPKDPDQQWLVGPNLNSYRSNHAVVLRGGKVELYGGSNDPTFEQISFGGSGPTAQVLPLPVPLLDARATLREDGSVLLVSGKDALLVEGAKVRLLSRPEAFHRHHTQTLLPGGIVLVAGGNTCPTDAPCPGLSELFLGPSSDDPGSRVAGASCTASSDCVSGVCSVDKVCCDNACEGVCETCLGDGNGKAGECHPVASGTDPSMECTGAQLSGCGTVAVCNGMRACACAAATCTEGHYVQLADGRRTDCAPYACAAGACLASCSSTSDCAQGSQCDTAGKCGVSGAAQPSDESGGCGCALAPRPGTKAMAAVLLALLSLAIRSRRRLARAFLALPVLLALLVLVVAPARAQASPWTTLAGGTGARIEAATAVLPGGRLLICGGSIELSTVASAVVVDPDALVVSPVSPMGSSRRGHSATTLSDGRVLVVAGGPTNAETFDPSTGSWSSIDCPSTEARSGHTTVLLDDGRVLVAGGVGTKSVVPTTAIFDPKKAGCPWSLGPALKTARSFHSAAPLPGGGVMVTGGAGKDGALASTEILDSPEGSWREGPPMKVARAHHLAVLLKTGKLLVAGTDAALFDPATSTWTEFGAPTGKSTGTLGAANQEGRYLLLTHDLTRAALFDVTSGWETITGTDGLHLDGTAAALEDGSFLIAGGYSDDTAELFRRLESPSTCTQSGDCISSSCRGGVCCENRCDGVCSTCRGSARVGGGNDGPCGPSTAGTDPESECLSNAPAGCPSIGLCDGQRACACSEAICTDERTLKSSTSVVSCSPYRCSGAACLLRCGSNADCLDGAICSAQGTCGPPAASEPPSEGCSCRLAEPSASETLGMALFSLAGLLTARSAGFSRQSRTRPSTRTSHPS